jgi:hypothetical protein
MTFAHIYKYVFFCALISLTIATDLSDPLGIKQAHQQKSLVHLSYKVGDFANISEIPRVILPSGEGQKEVHDRNDEERRWGGDGVGVGQSKNNGIRRSGSEEIPFLNALVSPLFTIVA